MSLTPVISTLANIVVKQYYKYVSTGTTGDDYAKILDIDMTKLGCKYLAIVLENTGSNSLDFELRKTVEDADVEDVETSGTLSPGDYAMLEVSRPLTWRLYVKNSTSGQSTTYKVTAIATR